jgi:shikimate kinase
MSRPIDRVDPAVHARVQGGRRRAPANVILVGLSGSGKSTVGRLLARRLGWRFFDTDQEIRRRTGRTIEAIFRDQGEPAFRALESRVLGEACSRHHQVIATGGGAVIAPENRACMLDGNLVVWLEGAPETLATRLERSVSREARPLLVGGEVVDRLTTLRRDREQFYACAHQVIRTDHNTPREVAERLAALVRGR